MNWTKRIYKELKRNQPVKRRKKCATLDVLWQALEENRIRHVEYRHFCKFEFIFKHSKTKQNWLFKKKDEICKLRHN